ncbi:MAG: alpha/beta hydrolase [Roseateles depolymerans]|uniref:Alpha/beta hydrolase n=1 Tax=Roseateles depolymerans TaxID=76731 RepID=A0A2W5DYZ7_9BURK|nr:MAG: alpha/beta hydrolase [Roseateles depolymerans]
MIKVALLSLLTLLVVLLLAALAAFLWLRAPDLPAAELEARWVTPADHYLSLGEGLRVHYRDEGPRDAPVLLLVHGYGDSYATWEGWAAELRATHRVISLDLPGHGLTAAPAGTVLERAAQARLVAAFAEQLRLPPYVVAGNSMGGGVAWQLALLAPQQLRGLVLVDAAGWPMPVSTPSLAFRILGHPWGRALLERIDNRPLIRQGLSAQVGDKALITDALVDRWALYQRYPGHRPILMSAAPGAQAPATEALLAGIHLPTLVLHGEIDPILPLAHGRQFAAAIPGAQLIVYAGVGHLPQREIPQRSAADVAAFVARLPAP